MDEPTLYKLQPIARLHGPGLSKLGVGMRVRRSNPYFGTVEFQCTGGHRFTASARRTFRRCKIRGCEKNAWPRPLR